MSSPDPQIARTIARVLSAPTINDRVAALRLVERQIGTDNHGEVYAEVARQGYLAGLSAKFAYVHTPSEYEPKAMLDSLAAAVSGTAGFTRVSQADLVQAVTASPIAVLALRTLTGLAQAEFVAAAEVVQSKDHALTVPLSSSRLSSLESGRIRLPIAGALAALVARTVDELITQQLFRPAPAGQRSRQTKFDTDQGWVSVRAAHTDGVPLGHYLHQRHVGGSVRQLLDATSSKRGDQLEEPVEALLLAQRIPYLRTGSHNQGDIKARFDVRINPAPDFVIFDDTESVRALLECKYVGDGGTARDKALRFAGLRRECARLNNIPLIAVLDGLGWRRTMDALGPVVRDTEGRVFNPSTLDQMLDLAPLPSLIGTA